LVFLVILILCFFSCWRKARAMKGGADWCWCCCSPKGKIGDRHGTEKANV
jgi:hypothetical protein